MQPECVERFVILEHISYNIQIFWNKYLKHFLIFYYKLFYCLVYETVNMSGRGIKSKFFILQPLKHKI